MKKKRKLFTTLIVINLGVIYIFQSEDEQKYILVRNFTLVLGCSTFKFLFRRPLVIPVLSCRLIILIITSTHPCINQTSKCVSQDDALISHSSHHGGIIIGHLPWSTYNLSCYWHIKTKININVHIVWITIIIAYCPFWLFVHSFLNLCKVCFLSCKYLFLKCNCNQQVGTEKSIQPKGWYQL